MTWDPGCTQQESRRLSCALSAAPSSDSPPPGGNSAPCQPGVLGSKRALPALSAPPSRLAASPPRQGLGALARPPLSPPAERICGTRGSVLPVPPPIQPQDHGPPLSPLSRGSGRALGPSAQRPLPQPPLGAARSPRATCKRLPRNFSQLHRGRQPPLLPPPPSEPATLSKPQKQTQAERRPSPARSPRSLPPPAPGNSWLARGDSPPPGGEGRGGGHTLLPPHPFTFTLARSPPSHPAFCCPHPHPGVATAGPGAGLRATVAPPHQEQEPGH